MEITKIDNNTLQITTKYEETKESLEHQRENVMQTINTFQIEANEIDAKLALFK